MQKYKTYRAMAHKLRLRGIYYYGWRYGGIKLLSYHAARDYYRFEKGQCKDLDRTCQSAFFTYNCPEPIWRDGLTYYEGDFGKPK